MKFDRSVAEGRTESRKPDGCGTMSPVEIEFHESFDDPNPKHTALTREQALAWRENWSASDISLIQTHLDRLNITAFYLTPSASYIACLPRRLGMPAMWICPGYVEFHRDSTPLGSGSLTIELSTFRARGEAPAGGSELELCPSCNMALSRVC